MHYVVYLFTLLVTICTITNGKECNSEVCKRFASFLKSSRDTAVDPCDDFSSYVCGKFEVNHKIPPGRSSSSSSDDVEDEITLILKNLLESQPLTDKNLPQTKAAMYYRSCLNMTQRNKLSKEPILKFMNQVNKGKTYEDKLIRLISSGMSTRIFSFSADQDSKNPEYYLLNIGKPEFILSDGTLQSPEEPDEKKQIQSYKKYMNKILDLLGMWKNDRSVVEKIVDLNIRIAKILPSMVDLQDPEKIYNKIKLGDLEKRCSQFPIKKIINQLAKETGKQLSSSDNVVIFSLKYFDEICKLLNSTREVKEALEMDLVWAAISSVIKFTSEEFVQAADELKKALLGVVGKDDQWKICVDATSGTLVEVVGNMYVKTNFNAERKKDAEDMLLNIRSALKEVLTDINWMDNSTKHMALLKLNSIKQKIGYSEKILNETYLMKENAKIKVDIGQYAQNQIECKTSEFLKSMTGIGDRTPEDKWFMGSQEVNAYYNPPSNEIVFPAAIFRFPFYDLDFPVSSNYGGMGATIGHEILHGFDISGSKFDDKGQMRDWWTEETRSKYTSKSQCVMNQYGNYTIYGKNLPSEQTIGEDVADNAGTRMAYKGSLMSKREKTTLPGLDYSSDQLFFITYAMSWCSVFTKELVLDKLKTDEHTIWKFRINGPLENMPEFSKAFNCSQEKKMNRRNKCIVF